MDQQVNYATIYLDRLKIMENITTVSNYLKSKNCSLAISTKSLPLNSDIMQLFEGVISFYDNKLSNINLLLNQQKETISRHQINHRFHKIIIASIDDLNTLNIKSASLYLFFDLGDGREGLSVDDIEQVKTKLFDLQPSSITISSNIGCLSSSEPSYEYFNKFKELRKKLEENNFIVKNYSLGSSNCIPFLDAYSDSIPIELRVGEAILFGTYDKVASNLLNLHKDCIFFETTLLRKYTPDNGLFNFGYTRISKGDIKEDQYKIDNQSSDYSILNASLSEVNSEYKIPLTYKGLSKLSLQQGIKFVLF